MQPRGLLLRAVELAEIVIVLVDLYLKLSALLLKNISLKAYISSSHCVINSFNKEIH